MEEDFQSLSKGVFVVPFNASSAEAGPSKPHRPLKRVYDDLYSSYENAHHAFETERMEEQLDDVSDWLDSKMQPSILKRTTSIKRISIAVMQDMAELLPSELNTLGKAAVTTQARDTMDLTMGIRNIALGFIGDEGLNTKNGKSGMDEVEEWYIRRKDDSPILLHIQQAQLIPPAVLSELIYILSLHPAVPIRLLLSVSSTSLFLSSWTHVEPSLIDLTIIHPTKARKRGSAIDAILRAARDGSNHSLNITDDLADDLKELEASTGGGPAAVLKALKWTLLHHSFNSPLSRINDVDLDKLQAIHQAVQDGKDNAPGTDLLQIDTPADLISTLDPAPRISISHALSHPEAYVSTYTGAPEVENDTTPKAKRPQNRKTSGRKRQRDATVSPVPVDAEARVDVKEGGDLKELQMLHGLWKAAGKNVNLWDWLEGFRDAVTEATRAKADTSGETADQGPEEGNRSSKKQRKETDPEEEAPEASESLSAVEGGDIDPEQQDRLHAAFIRFCEEARMMGLVRARGGRTAKRTDEVVKGIGLV